MIIDPSLLMNGQMVKAGAVRLTGGIQTEAGYVSHALSKMPTPELREALTYQDCPGDSAIAAMGRAKKFVEFRGREIALEEINGFWFGVARKKNNKNSRWHMNTISITVTNVDVIRDRDNWLTTGILNPRSKRNALLLTMINASESHVRCLCKTWKKEYIDFPTDWDWICAPDQVLPLTDESSRVDSPQVESPQADSPQVDSVDQTLITPTVVDGVWLGQPLECQLQNDSHANLINSDHVLRQIHALRNNPAREQILAPVYSDGFSVNSGCYCELSGHPILSKLRPKLQHIIRQVVVTSGERENFLDIVIPYLRITAITIPF